MAAVRSVFAQHPATSVIYPRIGRLPEPVPRVTLAEAVGDRGEARLSGTVAARRSDDRAATADAVAGRTDERNAALMADVREALQLSEDDFDAQLPIWRTLVHQLEKKMKLEEGEDSASSFSTWNDKVLAKYVDTSSEFARLVPPARSLPPGFMDNVRRRTADLLVSMGLDGAQTGSMAALEATDVNEATARIFFDVWLWPLLALFARRHVRGEAEFQVKRHADLMSSGPLDYGFFDSNNRVIGAFEAKRGERDKIVQGCVQLWTQLLTMDAGGHIDTADWMFGVSSTGYRYNFSVVTASRVLVSEQFCIDSWSDLELAIRITFGLLDAATAEQAPHVLPVQPLLPVPSRPIMRPIMPMFHPAPRMFMPGPPLFW